MVAMAIKRNVNDTAIMKMLDVCTENENLLILGYCVDNTALKGRSLSSRAVPGISFLKKGFLVGAQISDVGTYWQKYINERNGSNRGRGERRIFFM